MLAEYNTFDEVRTARFPPAISKVATETGNAEFELQWLEIIDCFKSCRH